MEFRSRDGQFAVVLDTASDGLDARFFVLRLRLGGVTIGDGQPAIVWQDLASLRSLKAVTDERLDPARSTADDLFRLTLSDDHLYEQCRVDLGELFDAWTIRAYRWDDRVVWLLRSALDPTSAAVVVCVLDFGDYLDVVVRAVAHHEQLAGSR